MLCRRAGAPALILTIALISALASTHSMLLAQTPAPVPGNQHFARTWDRTDRAVAEGAALRTWMWGQVVTDAHMEEYAEAPNGQREVQYFDKSRMEITYPDADPNSVWYVTNGLLVVEMITGLAQLGDTEFQWIDRAEINVAGDSTDPDSPTYRTFANLLDPAPNRSKLLVQEWLDRDGTVTLDYGLEEQFIWLEYYDDVTGHNIAYPFWLFMTSQGLVWEDDAYTNSTLFQDPFFATGRPITEPYWAKVDVAGIEELVMMQCFERRCLTYTPSNAPEWRVEAGNVGEHYHAWRYEGAGRLPPAASGGDKLVFLNGETERADVWTIDRNGENAVNLTWDPEVTTWRSHQSPVWSPDGSQIAFVRSFLVDGVPRADLYVMNADGSNIRKLTDDPTRAYTPVWSPDGNRIIFGSWRSGGGNLYIVDVDDGELDQLTYGDGHDEPGGWSATGDQIVFERTFPSGDVPTGDIFLIDADGTGIREIAEHVGSDRTPVWSPDGTTIAFMSTRAGDADIWLVDADDSNLRQLTVDPGADRTPSWSPDGSQLVYACGDFNAGEICLINADGTGLRQLTDHVADDYDPVWSPDGSQIAFVSNRLGDKDIFLITPDGNELQQLTSAEEEDFDPHWSP